MSCESIFRDISDIHSRLFNHRAALQGLASSFVKEFEEKRGDTEINSLSRCLEAATGCKEHAMPFILEKIGKHLEELKKEATTTAEECQSLLAVEEEKKEWLQLQRERRKEEWDSFMAAQVTRSARVDNDYENRVAALQKHYSELEEKLKGNGKVVL